MNFEIVCPNNHDQTVSFKQDEFEAAVKSGLEFHCNTCDTNWTPTKDQIEEMRRGFERAK